MASWAELLDDELEKSSYFEGQASSCILYFSTPGRGIVADADYICVVVTTYSL